ncbi:hypothetical protein J2R99_001873 [Rhodopseudomonas julia]|uniref:Uncharacterized protein n=1 Tax=Rhodopseudomonas julia TaxID=200617 RepID=A0ABU0C7Q5_9BRAD|nr:hypothetical protein [Rhodopseudomonas julia]
MARRARGRDDPPTLLLSRMFRTSSVARIPFPFDSRFRFEAPTLGRASLRVDLARIDLCNEPPCTKQVPKGPMHGNLLDPQARPFQCA